MDEMDTPSALRFQQMKAYFKNKVDSNKDNLKKKTKKGINIFYGHLEEIEF